MPTRLEGDRVLVNNRWVHGDGGNLGFLNTGGGWAMYANDAGQIWAANYGWLHDRFAQAGTFHHAVSVTGNCATSFGGDIAAAISGNTIQLSITPRNCNCDCACGW